MNEVYQLSVEPVDGRTYIYSRRSCEFEKAKTNAIELYERIIAGGQQIITVAVLDHTGRLVDVWDGISWSSDLDDELIEPAPDPLASHPLFGRF